MLPHVAERGIVVLHVGQEIGCGQGNDARNRPPRDIFGDATVGSSNQLERTTLGGAPCGIKLCYA